VVSFGSPDAIVPNAAAGFDRERVQQGGEVNVTFCPSGTSGFSDLLSDVIEIEVEGTAELTFEAHTAGRPETTGRMLFSSRKW
jgi:hypothetical protein